MDYLSSGNRYAYLSLADLLTAREQFHAHLVHKRHVIGTAVGRYLIRKGDPYPNREGDQPRRAGKKPPRTIEESEIRDYSWPCVLVFVDKWIDESEFGKGEVAQSDYVPKTIYMPDGKAVPICLVLAPRLLTPPDERPSPVFDNPALLQGGHPIAATTQHVDYRGTAGCLLTDGHKVYVLTARHVAGAPGNVIPSIGTSSALQLSRVPFENVYAPWPGKHAFVNFDVGLIEVEDLTKWSSGIESIGPIGPMATLSTYNLSLNLIGCPVRAHGASSGRLAGRIAALFYRYKAVGGFDYMSDFLIAGRGDSPLPTLPGDSGTLWVVDSDEDGYESNQPIAVQWGGTVLGAQERQTTFALASNLSTVCRELNVDVYRGSDVAAFEYWGKIGHTKIAVLATRFVRNPTLKEFLRVNRTNLGLVANFPDNKWVGGRHDEGPNHYSDVDLSLGDVKSLEELTPNATKLDPNVWIQYYADLEDAGGELSHGLLPFRVWQVFKRLREIVGSNLDEKEKADQIIAGMGILAHYIGDSCQPLHSSYLTHGDPFRHPEDGSKSDEMLPFKTGYGTGVHGAYESDMVKTKASKLQTLLNASPTDHGFDTLVETGREAGWAALQLMHRSRATLPPMDIVNAYAKAVKHQQDTNDALWSKFADQTAAVMIDGCSVLAMLWDSAWANGGDEIDSGELVERKIHDLEAVCKPNGDFMPSLSLDDIEGDL